MTKTSSKGAERPTIRVPARLYDRAVDLHGEAVARDPGFWEIALDTGIEELERQYHDVMAEPEDESGTVTWTDPTLIKSDYIPF